MNKGIKKLAIEKLENQLKLINEALLDGEKEKAKIEYFATQGMLQKFYQESILVDQHYVRFLKWLNSMYETVILD